MCRFYVQEEKKLVKEVLCCIARRLARTLALPCCCTLAVISEVFALPPVQPTLPPMAYLDTETVTNVPFTAWQQHLRYFTFRLAFNATPSNNVEMAFGTDRSTGTTGILPVEDGVLSPDERDLVVGWDCGAWCVENGATGERLTAAPAGGCGVHELAVRVRIDHQGTVDDVRFLDNGTEVFAELAASKPLWLHSSGWNRLRLIGRGENIRAGERFFAQIMPQGTSVKLR